MDELSLAADEQVLGLERCGASRRTAVLTRACAIGLTAAVVALVVGLLADDDARLAAWSIAGIVFVAAIPLGWFALVRSLEDPRLRAVTSARAVVVTRSGDVHEIPLERVTRFRPAGAQDWAGATGLALESSDGEQFQMRHPDMVTLGPAVAQAIALRSRRPD